jgi:hypothetical protein
MVNIVLVGAWLGVVVALNRLLKEKARAAREAEL